MRLCELKQKEIINTCTCRCLGCPIDVEFDCKTGQITALVQVLMISFCFSSHKRITATVFSQIYVKKRQIMHFHLLT